MFSTKSSIKKIILTFSAIAMVISMLAACDEKAEKTTKRKKSSPTIATFSRGKVTEEEFKEFTSQLSKVTNISTESLSPEAQESLVREIVARELVEKEARKMEINKDPEIKEAVKEFQAQLIRQKYLAELTKGVATEEKIKERYDNLAKELEGKEEIKVRHILLKDKETAGLVRKELAKGKSFGDLAKQYSLDAGTRDKGGELGYFIPGQLDKAFEMAVLALKKGEVSQPSSTGLGWHIIEVIDRHPAEPLAYSQAKNVIKQQLKKEFVKNYMNTMIENANIRMKDSKKSKKKAGNT